MLCFSLQFVYLLRAVVMHYRSILFLILCSSGFDSFCKGRHSSKRQEALLYFVPRLVYVCLGTEPTLYVHGGCDVFTVNSAIKFLYLTELDCKDYSYSQSFELRCVLKKESQNYK